jgi:hypothetical protein
MLDPRARMPPPHLHRLRGLQLEGGHGRQLEHDDLIRLLDLGQGCVIGHLLAQAALPVLPAHPQVLCMDLEGGDGGAGQVQSGPQVLNGSLNVSHGPRLGCFHRQVLGLPGVASEHNYGARYRCGLGGG